MPRTPRLQIRALARCPRCSKKFKGNAAVVNHMNQPRSLCNIRHQILAFEAEVSSRGQTAVPVTVPRSESPFANSGLPQNDENPETSQSDSSPNSQNILMEIDDPWLTYSSIKQRNYHIEEYAGAAKTFGQGQTFMDKFDQDQHASKREGNLYYPFASREEWQLAEFLLQSDLSMKAIDKFLKLDLTKKLGLSFRTSKDLRSRVEILPAGPQWKSKPWKTVFSTKRNVTLYYRDPLDCLQSIMDSPLVRDHINFKPLQLFRTAEKTMRVYTEWLSGDAAWQMQSQLYPGATILGTILSSDKTNISAMTGNRVAHPLLISLANLDMDFRNKSSNHAFLLLALLPIPKFIHRTKRICGVLADRLYHECISFVIEPLKKAAQIGIMMNDPLGCIRHCFTPLAACIVDTPESTLIAGVCAKTSSVTMASYKQFGDAFRHEPRTASTTIAKLQSIQDNGIDPWDIEEYFKAALAHRLNGVHCPFWINWPLSEPSDFLTSEPLHHWHKGFWDHDAKWCINAVGEAEIDFRFSVLPPHTGLRHFKEGISSLKQVTGREHRDIQRYIIPVIAGAVTKRFMIAVRSLMDFRYLAQAPVIDEATCLKIDAALKEFHDHKDAILEAGARRGQGNEPIENWHIPKLEFLQSVVPNIRTNGVAIQWSADITEHANITVIKDPARSGNNQNYEPQICRYLDRQDKCRNFDLATAVRDAGINFRAQATNTEGDHDDTDSLDGDIDDNSPLSISRTTDLLDLVDSMSPLTGNTRGVKDYFAHALALAKSDPSTIPQPARTFAVQRTAVHLTRDAKFRRVLINKAADTFDLPDFRPALRDYLTKIDNSTSTHISTIGGRRTARTDCILPFDHVDIWPQIQLQTKAYHYPYGILSPKTINAAPPSHEWPSGRYDAVIANLDPTQEWPNSGLRGHQVVCLRMVFRIVLPGRLNGISGCHRFLCYVQRYDVVPQLNSQMMRGQYPEASSGLYLLKPAYRANRTYMGDIIPLDQIRELVELTPNFGGQADRQYDKNNIREFSPEFWLDKYFNKELFYALHE